MIILDTNIVSEAWRPSPIVAVSNWLDAQPASSLYLCTPVLAELRYGTERLARGKRRDFLEAAIDKFEAEGYRGRILPFDTAAATEFGRLMVKREREGRRMETMDAMIAAITAVHQAVLATRAVRDFAGLGFEVINPFDPAP
jgi:predicted nucleic acid-binding protein